MRSKKEKKQKSNWLIKIVTIVIFIVLVAIAINIAPNYIRNEIKGKINLVINNNNVTSSLKFDVIVDENEIVYVSTKDIANFFDGDIYYDNKYDQLITGSDEKIAVLPLGKKEITVNSVTKTINSVAKKIDDNFYIPFSELSTIYNVETKYNEEKNIVTIDSLDRSQINGNASTNTNIKYKATTFSKTLDKVQKGENVIVIETLDNGWMKVRTARGVVGYTKSVTNIYTVREEMKKEKQIEGKVSLVWDYYSEYVSAPDRSGTTINGVNVVSPSFAVLEKLGKGELDINIGEKGKAYVDWAHNNGYKVWPMISNNSMKETTSEILNDYKLREKLINNIVNLAITYNVDGINIDFENIYMEDKEVFSRFIIELAPRLREYGKVLSVDVTAPDGSEDWSLCYDRYKIGEIADYIVFMAYDQNGATAPKEGTTAGANWVEANIKKFVGQEGVEAEKIILGMPFYTRLWKETNGQITSTVVSMKSIDTTIPSSAQKVWDDDLKQYYVEYTSNGSTYKMWIEDEESIKAKFDLMNKYKLAGAAYWAKDREISTLWDVIAEQLK